MPKGANFMDDALVFVAHRETSAGPGCQIVDFLLNPGDGIFGKDRRGSEIGRLVTDNQFVVLDPDFLFPKM